MRIGILTSGGDTPGMNAVIRGAYIRSKLLGIELVGFKYGWKGLMENIQFKIDDTIIENIQLGGTILGSSRTNPFKHTSGLELIKETFSTENLNGLIAIGGEDTLGVAEKLNQNQLNVVGVPKTIDNDLDETDYTFGFNTAITIATEAMDRLTTTAKSHERVIVVEIMGRHAGWMTLHSGIAAGAHAILIPEFNFPKNDIIKIIENRYKSGNKWALVAVSEGYGFTDHQTEDMEKDEFGHVLLDKIGVSKKLARFIEAETGIETRSIVLGHVQRGGSPTSFDRVLSTQLGLYAINLCKHGKFGYMPALKGTKIVDVQLSAAVSKLKTVDETDWKVALDLMAINLDLAP